MKETIIFKSEQSMWASLASGERAYDPRRWDIADERIYRLSWGHFFDPRGRTPEGPGVSLREMNHLLWGRAGGRVWVADEKEVSFVNKVTGEILTFEYLGVEFADWAPGWGFLILGKLQRREKELSR